MNLRDFIRVNLAAFLGLSAGYLTEYHSVAALVAAFAMKATEGMEKSDEY